MWTQSQLSFALQRLKPLIVEKKYDALELTIQQRGLDLVVSDALCGASHCGKHRRKYVDRRCQRIRRRERRICRRMDVCDGTSY